MNKNGDYGIPVPDYVEENVSSKVIKIIQSYTGVVIKWCGEKTYEHFGDGCKRICRA